MVNHVMHCKEQPFSTGTWGGLVLTGFTVCCGECGEVFVVKRNVVELGASIYSIRSVRDLTCPYCGVKLPTVPEQRTILEDHSGGGEY